MIVTKILKRYPPLLVRQGDATLSKLLSANRSHRFSDDVTAPYERSFDDSRPPSLLVTTKFHPDLGIAEVAMHNGTVNSLSLEM
jgi:hypothetical protein